MVNKNKRKSTNGEQEMNLISCDCSGNSNGGSNGSSNNSS